MRKHQKRWVALAGAAAVSAAGLVASGGAAAAEERPEDKPFAWPTVTRQSSTYAIDGFEIGYLPAGLDRMGIHAKSDTGHSGERVSTIKWVQGPDAVYGRLTIIRSADITGLEELREARYGHLKDASLKKTENNETEAYLSEKTGDLFWVPESGVGVEAYLQPERWDSEELVAFADGVSKREAPGETDGAEEAGEEAGEGADGDAEASQESADSDQATEDTDESGGDTGETDGAEEPAEAEQPAQEQPGDSGADGAEAVDAKGTQQQGAEDPEPESEVPEEVPEEAPETGEGTPDAEGTEGTEVPEEVPGTGEQPEGTTETEVPEEVPGTGEQPEDTPDAEVPEEVPGAGEGTPDAEGTEGTEDAEGAHAEGSFVPGVSLMDVRTCVAEDLLAKDAEASPAEVAADRDALLKLWNSVGSDTRSEAARACAPRFEVEPTQVEQVMSDLAARSEEASDGSEPSTEQADMPADGAETTKESPESETGSGSDETGTAEGESEDDVFELWDMLPVTLPDLSFRQ